MSLIEQLQARPASEAAHLLMEHDAAETAALLAQLNPAFAQEILAALPATRRLPVIAADKQVAGTVVEIWVNRSEPQVSYYEVQLAGSDARRLLPVGFVQWPNLGLWGNDKLLVKSITAAQFANVPTTKRDDQITLLEEDKIGAYYCGGHLYAKPDRAQPIL